MIFTVRHLIEIAVKAALERLYKARQKESEKDMTNVINDDGSAFPIVGQPQDVHEIGMTLRDYFAAKAMQAWISRGDDSDSENAIAKWTYEMADAMLKARQAKND